MGIINPRYVPDPGLQIVGSRSVLPAANFTAASAVLHESRIRFQIGPQDATDIRFGYCNFYRDTAGDVSGANAINVQAAFEELATGGNVVNWRGSFDGKSSVDIAVGNQITLTDPFAATLAANSLHWARTAVNITAGQSWPGGYTTLFSPGNVGILGDYFRNTPTGTPTQVYGTSALTNGADAAPSLNGPGGYGPIAILGIPKKKHPAVFIDGDSITYGQNDVQATLVLGVKGWVERGLIGLVSYHNSSRAGDRLLYAAGSRYSQSRRVVARYCTHVLCGLGNNDVTNRTLAQMQADAVTLWGYYRSRGKKVYHTYLTPRTTSANSFIDAAQTPVAGYESGGIKDQFNTWLTTAKTSGLVDGLLDIRPYCEDATTPSIWKYNGTPNYYSEGTHPSAVTCAAAAVVASNWAATLS